MEAEGTSLLWEHYVERNSLRYTKVIADRDAKSVKQLNKEHPYGEEVLEVITFILITIIMVIIYLLSTCLKKKN